MKTSDLKETILQMFKSGEFYGYEVHRKLAAQGRNIEIGSLYRVLNAMLRDGLLDAHWEKSFAGPKKRLYKISEKGRRQLAQSLLTAIETVHTFYGEYLSNLPRSSNVFESLFRHLTKGLKRNPTIALVASNPSPMYERILHAIRNTHLEPKIYLVCSKFVNNQMMMENIISLEGQHESIPLKSASTDLLITDMPKKAILEKAATELRRVAKENGQVAILAPTIMLHRIPDPLDIGEFVEKWEHQELEKEEFVDSEIVQNLLLNEFEVVEEKRIVHMTLITASKPRASD